MLEVKSGLVEYFKVEIGVEDESMQTHTEFVKALKQAIHMDVLRFVLNTHSHDLGNAIELTLSH
jgi:hypothetical protein